MNLRLNVVRRVALLVLCCGFAIRPSLLNAAIEETYETLQIGTHTYRNVTVTTKAKNYIFIMHSTGMTNIKIADLPPELQKSLGYTGLPEATSAHKGGAPGSSPLLNKLKGIKFHLPQFKAVQGAWRAQAPRQFAAIQLTPNFMISAGGALVLLYLLMSYCSMLICNKAGHPPGFLVWVPVLQFVPLLRAAGMSPAWLLAFLVPVVNIIVQIVWSLNIAKARGKSAWVGVFLVLPLTALFAYLYLALSGRPAAKKEAPVNQIMTLDAA